MPRGHSSHKKTSDLCMYNPPEQVTIFDDELQNAVQLRSFVCHSCNRSYSNKSGLCRHEKLQHNSEPHCENEPTRSMNAGKKRCHVENDELLNALYQCNQCNQKFAQLNDLEQHAETHVRMKPYKCSRCIHAFSTTSALEAHVKRHDKPNRFKCTMCSYATASSQYLKQHMRNGHRADRPHRCSQCRKNFRTLNDLKFHLIRHRGEPYSCPHCEKTYNLFSTLRQHMQVHTFFRRFACSKCGWKFIAVKDLHRHMLRHGDAGPHKCTFCEKSYHSVEVLRLHLAWHDRINRQKLYTCLSCDRTFRRQKMIEKHVLCCSVVNEGVELLCTLCNRVFVNAMIYNRHMAKHASESVESAGTAVWFGCNKCSRKFSSKHLAFCHFLSHDPMPYECGLCGRCFRETEKLRTHLLGHPIGVLCVCGICREEFTQLTDLAEHTLSHPGEFKCDHCDQSFLCLRDQRKHTKTHVTGYLFNCNICYTAFTSRENLKRHLQMHKNGDISSEAVAHIEEPQTEPQSSVEMQTGEVSSVKRPKKRMVPKSDCDSVPFICEKCDKTYKTKQCYDRHVLSCLVVDESLRLTCTLCDRVFTNSMVFKEHMARHAAETRSSRVSGSVELAFKCDKCLASFSTKAKIEAHQLRHDPRVYGCSQCALNFKDPVALTKHMGKHPEAGMFVCDGCGEKFPSCSELDSHISRHAGIFKCDQCASSFISLRHQRMHEIRDHGRRKSIAIQEV